MSDPRIVPAPLGPPVQLCSVGGCFEAPEWRIFRPWRATPAALFKACPAHLSMLMAADASATHNTGGYFVEPIR